MVKSLFLDTGYIKRLLCLLIVVFCFLNCKAQHIIPIEEVVNYLGEENGVMGDKNYVYLKDVNNVLGKFVGDWAGNYNGKNYLFRISKATSDNGEIKEDHLLMRYTITTSNGTVIENTLSLPDNKVHTEGGYLAKSGSYVFNYFGKDSDCGQNGSIFTRVLESSNGTKIKLYLEVEGEMWDCTTEVPQTMPTEVFTLTKQ